MLNLTNEIPVKQDCIEAAQNIIGQVRDLCVELEEILHLSVKAQDHLLTRQEVADYLRTAPDKIPHQIPRFRLANDLRFRESDVRAYVEERIKSRKY